MGCGASKAGNAQAHSCSNMSGVVTPCPDVQQTQMEKMNEDESLINMMSMAVEQVVHKGTPEQQAAAKVQEAIAHSAELAPAEHKNVVSSSWSGSGGPAMEALLENTTLIDANYYAALIQAKGVLPRWQDIPECAKIGPENAWRLRCWNVPLSLPVVCLTYCWLSKEHPDPVGEQMTAVFPVFKAMLDYTKQEHGEHATIGILQDYASYPQVPRTDEENQRFKRGLKTELNLWYTHPFTHVLMINTPASERPEHTNRRPYEKRGWCYVEKGLSSIVKDKHCMWDFSKYQGCPYSDVSSDFFSMKLQMESQRPPMVSPDRVSEEMRAKVESGALAFTSNADMEFVIHLYERGFRLAFDSYVCTSGRTFIEQKLLGWGDEEARLIAEALRYVQAKCTPEETLIIDLRGNDWGTDSGQAIKDAAEGHGDKGSRRKFNVRVQGQHCNV